MDLLAPVVEVSAFFALEGSVGATSACTTVTSRLGTALGQICLLCVEANDNARCQSQWQGLDNQ
jgi:hypothetical protein